MFNLIAISFLQKKYCRLPGIGSLTLVAQPAETDFVNSAIKAPTEEIVFKAENGDATGSFNEFTAISEIMLRQLNDGLPVEISGVGTFTQTGGIISFEPVVLSNMYTPAVHAVRVIRKDAEHQMLVGDKETTNTVMAGLLNDKPAAVQRWWIWALVAALASLTVLFLYLSQNGFNGLGSMAKP
ncbi:MAG TPA: hypothetical protein PKC39_12780 [Ferruginibacter sp.]|nr:hypothetical protein [Ferruginibacter sp.]HMP21827.1 hypothetical protein [Ferruginibacter sp.]